MPNPPSLLNRQPPEIKAEIATMVKTQYIAVIEKWLNDRGIDANYNQLRHYITTHNLRTRLYEIKPVKGYKAKVRVYIETLLEYDSSNYTIRNIQLRGPSWTKVSVAMHKAGLIEPMRTYSPRRWRILATKDELRAWMEKEILSK